ncbi:hypothetical protein PISL3812_03506 [Talaromyces islandicus]|uniref:Transcription factor domain-containing protein n=1 Tax=Talaromyces islandicus TaxID=28573 RepID=A0A0U1LV93_TALIS|nr:hypothetical protein PISL3812_03506 [Talaromyces islandicus]
MYTNTARINRILRYGSRTDGIPALILNSRKPYEDHRPPESPEFLSSRFSRSLQSKTEVPWTLTPVSPQRPTGTRAPIALAPSANASTGIVGGVVKGVNWQGVYRCSRLGKECRPANRVRKPKPLSRTAQLERTVNQLVSLLKSGDQASLGPAALPRVARPGSGEDTPSPTGNVDGTLLEIPASNKGHITVNSEDELLASFRTTKLRYFPFIHIPTTVKAKDFKYESPCLWHCITIIESKSASQSTALSKQFGDMVGHRLLVNNEKSLDLLYGLLAYLAWITYHCPSRQTSLGMYTQLAIGLVFELGLNKAPPLDSSAALAHCAAMAYNPRFKPSVTNVRTMNQRRAALGCYLISSCISQFLGRTNTLLWTSHMSECLDMLTESNETANDAVLVQLVSFWLMVDKISQGPWNVEHVADKQINRAPTAFYINAFESQLIDLINKVPTELHENPERLAVQLGQVAQSAGIDNAGSDDDSFSISARDMLKLRAAWASRMADSGHPATDAVGGPLLPDTEMGYMDNFLAWPESIWLTDPLMPGTLAGL